MSSKRIIGRVLVVDDEETVRDELVEALVDASFEASGAGDGESALVRMSEESFDVCISDIRMPGMDGLSLLEKVREQSPETMVVIITAYGDMETAIQALRLGASDYVLKPLLFEDIIAKAKRLIEHRKLDLEVQRLRRTLAEHVPTSGLVGESASMRKIERLIAKVAPTSSNVLISGDSGTGKELIARAIHEHSDRADEPFVPINCAAIPETLLESELFGHMKGSFTGAVSNKQGLMQTAGSGTIFLDEVGDMPVSIQAKLLRAIETREIQPVGSVRRIPVRARLIAATNKDLRVEAEEQRFRDDLYFRLSVLEIRVPPLRERRDDIPLLVAHFVDKYNRQLRRHFAGVDRQAMRLLVGHEWKGNIRELENTIERSMILADSEDLIRAADLPETIRASNPIDPEEALNLRQATRRFEQAHINQVIERCQGDKRRAAEYLGLSLSSLYRKLDPDVSGD
jgi:two-component system response regulator PilR (NtrC family)